jgi:hypothetical protein
MPWRLFSFLDTLTFDVQSFFFRRLRCTHLHSAGFHNGDHALIIKLCYNPAHVNGPQPAHTEQSDAWPRALIY